MNGPEHYKEAERSLSGAWDTDSPERRTWLLRDAQVRAALALAAAVGTLDAYQGPISGYSLARSDSDSEAWQAVTSTSDE